MKKSRFTEPQAEIGVAVLTVCRAYDISTKWRPQYSGTSASMMGQIKTIEEESRRLKRIFSGSVDIDDRCYQHSASLSAFEVSEDLL